MTTALLDRPTGTEHIVASGHGDRRRELRDRGHQLRAARRRSGLSWLKHASARPTCHSHGRRAVEAVSPQVRSGVYDTGAGGGVRLSCLANGTTKKIADVREGDMVLATDPETGESGAREVIATMPHTDQLLTLRLSSGDVVTTEDHRYWNATDGEWQESQDLDEGDQLLTADGDEVTVEGLDWTTVHTAPAYDLTIADLHTFYVAAGDEAVLVHNACLSPNQMNQAINWGQAPNGLKRVDTGKVTGEQTHIHFDDGAALNMDGTWKHGSTTITSKQRTWLVENGWVVP